MHRQVGDLQLNEEGIAQRGLLVRHLLLPGELSGTEAVLAFLANEISSNTYLNLMDQYYPCYRASENPPLDRTLYESEYQQAFAYAEQYGLHRLDHRRKQSWFDL